ncbi:MAG: CotS family spore coat protein [Lachnospiraceae bacterium]|nr:CotS family spore coat protein [Lachnospiraceae bacterium]
MNDRVIGLLDQYEIEVLRTRKGRGAILCETNQGILIFKEYQGSKEKAQVQDLLLKKIGESKAVPVEQIIPTKEGELLVQGQDGLSYILKTYFEGKECNILDIQDCLRGVKTLAYLHKEMNLGQQEIISEWPVFRLEKEYEKHNRELKRVRKYLREKSQKTPFEIYLVGEYDYFMGQAFEVTKEWEEFLLPGETDYLRTTGTFCHGDYQYHNIIEIPGGQAVINFEKCIIDDQIRDLYLYMRKLLEKSNWSKDLGKRILNAYNEVNELPARSFVALYYRLAYPEKFWKIVNFYYNSHKGWIPGKNQEKLLKVVEQEQEKQDFLNTIFRTI